MGKDRNTEMEFNVENYLSFESDVRFIILSLEVEEENAKEEAEDTTTETAELITTENYEGIIGLFQDSLVSCSIHVMLKEPLRAVHL